MAFAPQRDWTTYDSLVWKHELGRIQKQSLSERFERYAQLFELVYQAKQSRGRDSESELLRWKEKEDLRQRMVHAFLKLDELKRAEDNSTNAS